MVIFMYQNVMLTHSWASDFCRALKVKGKEVFLSNLVIRINTATLKLLHDVVLAMWRTFSRLF